ncbi:SpoIIE family protein phosphatase [candidate division KSB1 bacterium]
MPLFKKDIGLKLKITSMVIVLLLLLMSSVSYLFSAKELRSKRESIEIRMTEIAHIIASIMSVQETLNWELYQDFINNLPDVNKNIVYVAIFDTENNLKAHILNFNALVNEGGLELYSSKEIVEQLVSEDFGGEDTENLRNVKVPVNFEDVLGRNEKIGEVIVGFSMLDVNWEVSQIYKKSLILFVLFMVIGVAASIFLGSTLSNPLIKISNVLLKVSEGDLDQKLEVKTHDEIGKLSKTVNYMINELKEKEFFENFERELSKVLKPDKISILVLNELSKIAKTGKGLFTLSGDAKNFNVVYSNGFDAVKYKNISEKIVSQVNINETREKNVIVLCQEVSTNDNYRAIFREYRFDYMIILSRKGKIFGLFYLTGEKAYKTYDRLKFIENIMEYALLPYENALLYENLAEQERMKKELEIARQIQISLLPKQVPQISEIDMFGMCIPAKEVGGDYYDIIKIDDKKYGFVIADVSGKGTSAAFYMAEIKGMINTLSHIYKSPMELLKILNKRLFGTIDKKMFATMIYGVLDVEQKEFTFARAGHNALILKNLGGINHFLPKGIGIGLDKGLIFDKVIEEVTVPIGKGDMLFLYTDGISEAMDNRKNEFGEDKVSDFISALNDVSCKKVCDQLLTEVTTFAGDAEQNDDLTMIAIKHV